MNIPGKAFIILMLLASSTFGANESSIQTKKLICEFISSKEFGSVTPQYGLQTIEIEFLSMGRNIVNGDGFARIIDGINVHTFYSNIQEGVIKLQNTLNQADRSMIVRRGEYYMIYDNVLINRMTGNISFQTFGDGPVVGYWQASNNGRCRKMAVEGRKF